MTQQVINIYPKDNPDNFVWVSYVVDGDVAFVAPYPLQAESVVAAVSSSPTLIVLTGDDRLNVRQGWTYNGETFSPPPSA